MIRIIQQGSTRHTARCTECDTLFEYDSSDARHNYVRGGEWVSCPYCGCPVRHFGASGAPGARWGACEWRRKPGVPSA